MRLKELIAALETFQTDQKTGYQILGERPEIPSQLDGTYADIVLYVNKDMTDQKLLKTAKIIKGKYGDIPVIQAVPDLTVEVEDLTFELDLAKAYNEQVHTATAQQIKELESANAELMTEKEKADAEANDQIAKLQGEIKDLKAELSKTKKALKAAKKDEG